MQVVLRVTVAGETLIYIDRPTLIERARQRAYVGDAFAPRRDASPSDRLVRGADTWTDAAGHDLGVDGDLVRALETGRPAARRHARRRRRPPGLHQRHAGDPRGPWGAV